MFLVLTGILTRIITNSYLNVFQKVLTSKGAKSSVVNFCTYSGITILGLLTLIFKPENSLKIPIVNTEILITFFIMGLLGALGNYFIIRALSVGELSSLAPINSYKPCVAMVIAYFYLNEIPSPYALSGICLIILGTYFILNLKTGINKAAVFYRVLALIFSGSEAVFIKKIVLLTNVPISFFLWALSGLVFSYVFVLLGKHKIQIASYRTQLLLIISVFIMQYSTNYVFANMNVSYALALFQLSSLLSVFLGVNIFKEKGLTRKLIGSAIMIIGAITIILS